ncbi:hypothetical protein EV360DRAFT_75332 [Lentinula raphanica]|nr:hypothetical protein EV360DRAFT_75332 [Lentinula raphanica]
MSATILIGSAAWLKLCLIHPWTLYNLMVLIYAKDIPLSNPLSLRPPSISNQATPYLDSFSHQEHSASSSITLASGENHTPLQQNSDIEMFNAPVTPNTNSLCQLPPASALESDLHTNEEFKMDIDEEAEEEAVDSEAEMIEVSEPESDELPEEIENLEDCAHTVDTPTFLSRINIAVESVYRLCICISCAIPIPYQSIWTHQYQQHYRGRKLAPESRLPPRNIVLAKLQELGAHEPVIHSVGPIAPPEGIQLLSKPKCTLSGCIGFILGGPKQLENHCRSHHPDVHPSCQTSTQVLCFTYSPVRNKQRYIEVFPPKEAPPSSSTVPSFVQDLINAYDLFAPPKLFEISSDIRHESSTLYHSDWAPILDGVDWKKLRDSAQLSNPVESHFIRLRDTCRQYYQDIIQCQLPKIPILTRRYILSPSPKTDHIRDIESQPFKAPQTSGTIIRDSDMMARFLAFLIRTQTTPIDGYPVILHPDLDRHLVLLTNQLGDSGITTECLQDSIHTAICQQSSVSQQQIYVQEIQPFLTDGQETLFTSLRQHQKFYSFLAMERVHLPAFSFNMDHTVLTFNGFPITIECFTRSIHKTLDALSSKLTKLFRGCAYHDILNHIDQALDPSPKVPQWFIDHPTETRPRYSFFEEPRNGFQDLRPRLFNYLMTSAEFITSQGKPKAGAMLQILSPLSLPTLFLGAILEWFTELDAIVSDLWILSHLTWGGSPRGTEISGILYANHPTIPRNFYILNGLPSMFTRYSKTQHNQGHGKGIVRTPAYQVGRILILVLALPFWAASQLACCLGMSKPNCQRYLHEIFVLGGTSIKSAMFSTLLGNWTYAHLGKTLKLADFRQFNSTLMIHATSTTLDDPEDVDPLVASAHEQFGHSVGIGQRVYGVHAEASVTKMSADAIARMQRVSRAWHYFIDLVHPSLIKTLKEEEKASLVTGPPVTLQLLRSELKKQNETIKSQINLQMDQVNHSLVRKIEFGYTQIRNDFLYPIDVPSYANARRASVHPSARLALKQALGRGLSRGFTSQEQAELINSVGSSLHVFGIIETGGGKSMAFFAAPFLLPDALFIVISPLKALTDDLKRRLRETGISGGVWPSPDVHWDTSQLVLVSVHQAAGQDFHNLIRAPAIHTRLRRIFFDEAHKIPSDITYRPLFGFIHHLTRAGIPITFLSGSLMPRMIPRILDIMKIEDLSLVDEIRRDTGRPNLKYILQKTEKETHDHTLHAFISTQLATLGPSERGMIFAESRAQANMLAEDLGIPVYHALLADDVKTLSANRWRMGSVPQDRMIVATEAFGAGINEPHVRIVIHSNPWSLTNFLQETGRAGRDGKPAVCYTLFHRIPPALSPKIIEETGDPSGQMEMREALQTANCIRLVFQCMDRRSHSCSALPQSELCSNCEQLEKVPYSSAIVHYPQFNKPLVPESQTSQKLSPLTVELAGMKLDAAYNSSHQEIKELCTILQQIVINGCIDCWLLKQIHTESLDHKPDRYWAFQNHLGKVRTWSQPKSSPYRPICYDCFIPLRDPFHNPIHPNIPLDPSLCPFQILDTVTGAYTPLLPTLIVLIFNHRGLTTDDRDYTMIINERLDIFVCHQIDTAAYIINLSTLKTLFHVDSFLLLTFIIMTLKCPFCTASFHNEAQLYTHASRHSEHTSNSVQMDVGDTILLLTLDIESGLYTCPMDCRVKGSLGAMWAHFTETHARHPAKRTRPAETNTHRPLKFTRTEQGSSAPSFQTATSSTVTQSAPVSPTAKSSAVSLPVSPVSPASSALPALPMSQPSGMPLPAMSALQTSPLSASSASQPSATPISASSASQLPAIPVSVSSALQLSATPVSAPSILQPTANPFPSTSVSQLSATPALQPPAVPLPGPPHEIDLDRLFGDPLYYDTQSICAFIRLCFNELENSCPFHQIMQGVHASDHDLMCSCTDPAASVGSEYYTTFTRSLVFPNPQYSIFKHPPKSCYPEGNLRDWWRSIPYLVFRTQRLRTAVFNALGIDPDAFPSLSHYALWLVRQAIPFTDTQRRNRTFTNLAAIVFMFLYMTSKNTLEMPTGGHELDSTVPPPV